MQLITEVVTFGIVAQSCLIGKAEGLARLLTDHDAYGNLSGTVALSKFIRIGIGFDRGAEFLSGDKVQILDIVRIDRRGFSAGGALRNGGKTVPGNALRISAAGLLRVENALLNTGFVKTFAGLIPNEFRHTVVLL